MGCRQDSDLFGCIHVCFCLGSLLCVSEEVPSDFYLLFQDVSTILICNFHASRSVTIVHKELFSHV